MSSAFICGCAATVLTSNEQALFADARPWGLILFQRNIVSPQQVQALVAAFRTAVGDDDAPVWSIRKRAAAARAALMGRPIRRQEASARFIRRQAGGPSPAVRQVARLIADDLHALGITANCLPVLDVPAAVEAIR